MCVSETTRKPSQTYFKSLPDLSILLFCDHTTLETSAIWYHPNGNKNPPDVLLGDNEAVQTVVACSKHDHICIYVSKVLQLKNPYIKFTIFTNKSVGVDLSESWITRKMLKLKSGVNLPSIPVLAILRELMVLSLPQVGRSWSCDIMAITAQWTISLRERRSGCKKLGVMWV